MPNLIVVRKFENGAEPTKLLGQRHFGISKFEISMATKDDVSRIMGAIELESMKVLTKAEELIRLAKLRAKRVKCNPALNSACIHLACKVLNVPLEQEKQTILVQRSGATANKYKQLMVYLHSALGIPTMTESVKGIALKLGNITLAPFVEQTLATYKVQSHCLALHWNSIVLQRLTPKLALCLASN